MKNVKALLKKIKFRGEDGKLISLQDYIVSLGDAEMKQDITKFIEIVKTRVDATDDRQTLVELYAVFLSLVIGKEMVIPIGGNEHVQNR